MQWWNWLWGIQTPAPAPAPAPEPPPLPPPERPVAYWIGPTGDMSLDGFPNVVVYDNRVKYEGPTRDC